MRNVDVFISHANVDKPLVKPIIEALLRDGFSVFVDRPGDKGLDFSAKDIAHWRDDRNRLWHLRASVVSNYDDALLAQVKNGARVVLGCLGTPLKPDQDHFFEEMLAAKFDGKLLLCRLGAHQPDEVLANKGGLARMGKAQICDARKIAPLASMLEKRGLDGGADWPEPADEAQRQALDQYMLLRQELTNKLGGAPTARPGIDLTHFKSEIEKQLTSVPKTMERLERLLSLRLPNWNHNEAPASQGFLRGDDKARAEALVRLFVETVPFLDALEVITEAIESCTTELEQKERQALFAILNCFLPARFSREKAEEIKRRYELGDVHLIRADVASALAAELVMAAVQNRPANVDRDAKGNLAGKAAIIKDLPLGLGATPREELITAVNEYLYAKYGAELKVKSTELFLSTLNNIMRRRRNRDVPYLVLAHENTGTRPSDGELDELAAAVHAKSPWLAVLKLSDVEDVEMEEFDQLFSLREILTRY